MRISKKNLSTIIAMQDTFTSRDGSGLLNRSGGWGIHNLYYPNGDYSSLRLENADMHGETLYHATFNFASMTYTNLRKANVSWARFHKTWLVGANFEEIEARCAYFDYANLSNSNAQGGNFEEANFEKSDMRGANFTRTNLSDACLKDANCEGTNFAGANFERADLRLTYLKDAIMAGSKLTFEQLATANASKANLTGAWIRLTLGTFNHPLWVSKIFGEDQWVLHGFLPSEKISTKQAVAEITAKGSRYESCIPQLLAVTF